MNCHDYPRIIAHRCGGLLAPENSLAGLRTSADLGCRAVEFDVMLSADGEPVLMHDDTVDRTSTGRGLVSAMSMAELRQCDIGGEPVPHLAEALLLCQRLGLWANIELKLPENIDAKAFGGRLGKYLAAHWSGVGVISAFSTVALQAAQRAAPMFGYAWLVDSVPQDWRATAGDLKLRAIHACADTLNPQICQSLQAAGLLLAAYTVNDRELGDRLLADQVAIFTDRPGLWLTREM